MSDKHWSFELRTKHSDMKTFFSTQALGNYIILNYNEEEQAEILKHLQDPTKQITVSITAIEKPNTEKWG